MSDETDFWNQTGPAPRRRDAPWPEEPPPPESEAEYGERVVQFPDGSARERPPRPKPPALPLVWFEDIEAVLETQDFVQGILWSNSSIVVYGESNSGKTFWATNLALHVAGEMRWNDRRVDLGGVVYCILEGTNGFRNRVAAWKNEHGLDGHDLPFAAIPVGLNLRNPRADLPALIDAVAVAAERMGLPVRLIIIDTLSRAMAGGDENDPEDMGALVGCMDQLRQETGAAVMFIHHSGKDTAKGARGHSLLRGAVDTEIEVIADDEGGRTATIVKQREGRKGDTFPFTLRNVELGHNQHGEPITTCVVESVAGTSDGTRRRLTGHPGRALDVLADLLATAGQADHPGVPSGALSVPEKWWRDRFYDRAMPGAEDEAKRKAFRRTADILLERAFVGMGNKRVWLVSQKDERTGHE